MSFEDYTTFTETDPLSDITVAENTISFTDLAQGGDYRVYKDYGAGHFSGDFTHQFEVQFSDNVSNCVSYPWLLGNIVDTANGIIGTSGESAACFLTAGSLDFYLRLIEDGSLTQDPWPDAVEGTTYYITVDRDDDGGSNNTGRYTMYIRTGSHTGTLKDTLVVDSGVGEQNDFRYLYGLEDHGSGSGNYDGFVRNLDINEAAAYNITSINGVSLDTITSILGVALANIAKINGVDVLQT